MRLGVVEVSEMIVEKDRLGPQVRSLWQALRAGQHTRRILWMVAAMLMAIVANAVGQVRLNTWQGDFYNTLEGRQVDAFWHQAVVFLVIVAALLTLVVIQTWLTEMLKLRLREALTTDLLNTWLVPARAYLLRFAGQIGMNPDQRLHEDARKLTELTAGLGIGLAQSSLLLVSFIGVLWGLSANVTFRYGGAQFGIPGYMVWCALAYSLGGSLLAWRVGRPLVGINAGLYAAEAELRFSMVRLSESAEGVALYRGEADERAHLGRRLTEVIDIMVNRAWGLAQLTWVTSGYGWLALIFPILVAAPGYFSNDLTFGALMMVVGAFFQVNQSLRWFVDNVPTIADWRATLRRVTALRHALQNIDGLTPDRGAGSRIRLTRNAEPRLELLGVSVSLRDGVTRIEGGDLAVNRGDRLLITGDPESGKSTVFRSIAGLWPWGEGEIRLPEPDKMLFLPNRPYLPSGTLEETIAYPDAPPLNGGAAAAQALTSVGLGHLVGRLSEEARWDRELSLEEQQRLGFARALVQRPGWLLIDDAASAVGHRARRDLMLALTKSQPDLTIVVFGRDDDASDGELFTRCTRVVRDPAPGNDETPAAPE
ncbi:ABC transporter ATP-binding protein/permease [Tropicimonas isoalkanivorans]|uniref:Putative ATP-binding cassette transporter n=1 Tax=Tropicimonas isoalkanivorans TaxID=441112 RepID=A0A1I1NJV7_9RHOB|nr:ABC transporter ATP-binding protein/permease [Tropicimonas isoalkanivorans]SFC97765.1 putative ATP-binding cassette transporter [Tropicimonas isoalkanivorans]